MNSDGQRSWMWSADQDMTHDSGARVDTKRRTLRLASQRTLPSVAEDEVTARHLMVQTPGALDAFSHRVCWSPAHEALLGQGASPGDVPIWEMPGKMCTGLAIGYQDQLLCAVDGDLWLAHLGDLPIEQNAQDRDPVARLSLPDFDTWRVCASHDKAYAIDKKGSIAQVLGVHWRHTRSKGSYNADVFRPVEENPNTPRLLPWGRVPLDLATDEIVGLIISRDGRWLVALSWRVQGAEVVLFDTTQDPPTPQTHRLEGVERPYSIAWLERGRFAVRVCGRENAVVYEIPGANLEEGEVLAPVGEPYPSPGAVDGPLEAAVKGPAHVPTHEGTRPLYALSLPRLARHAEVTCVQAADAGASDVVWDRVYVEAMVPAGTGLLVWLAATNTPDAPAAPEAWHPHQLGHISLTTPPPGTYAERVGAYALTPWPSLAWSPLSSELPHAQGVLPCASVPNVCGLFGGLIQRSGHRTSGLCGRFLHVRMELFGSGTRTPEVAALRVWGPRVSYVRSYLPELYHESVGKPEADEAAPQVTPADFLERFVENASGLFSELEDRIGAAHLLTVPESVPRESLGWLAGWIAASLDPGIDEVWQRETLRRTFELHRWRGTQRGLKLALDLATQGSVSAGGIVLVENYKLRRTVGTILGAPTTKHISEVPWSAIQGGSYVGETLLLAEKQTQDELSAIFGFAEGNFEETVDAWYAKFAHRVTVLVQKDLGDEVLGTIRRVVAQEAPAHIRVDVVAASRPLVIGVLSLVGVDTYLSGTRPEMGRVRLDHTVLGEGARLERPRSVDPRLLQAEDPS